MIDLTAFFAETAAAASGTDDGPVPAVPVSRTPHRERQDTDKIDISRNSRISRRPEWNNEIPNVETLQAGAGAWVGVRARPPVDDLREQREEREQPAGSTTCSSRYPSRKREIERKTGNPDPLPAATDPDEAEERAAVLEYEGGLSRAEAEVSARGGAAPGGPLPQVAGPLWQRWRSALASLSPDLPPCPGYRGEEWPRVLARALAFLDTFGAQAEALGWTAPRLFGVHEVAGIVRADACGALALPIGGEVRAITADEISFGHLTHRRKPGQTPGVPLWSFGR